MNNHAIDQIEREIYLDEMRVKLGIPVDPDRAERLRLRLVALQTEDAETKLAEAEIGRRFDERYAPKPAIPSMLKPMGMDEYVTTRHGARVLRDQETGTERKL